MSDMDVDFVTGVPIDIDLTGQTGIDVIFGGYGGDHAPSIPGWNDISGKPTAFPTDWNTVTAKPSTFPAGWDDVTGKPTTFTPEPTLVVSTMQAALTADKGVAVTNSGSAMKVTEGPLRTAFEKPYTVSGVNAFGDMTTGGGLTAAFDGVTAKNGAASAGKASASNAYIGQDCTANPMIFSRAIIYGSSNEGYVSGANPTVTITAYGKNGSAPASATDGTVLGSVTFTDGTDGRPGVSLLSTDLQSQWDRWWIVQTMSPNGAARIAQVVPYCIDTGTLTPRIPSLRNRDFLNIRDIKQSAVYGKDDDTATWNTLIGDINSGFMKAWHIPDGVSYITDALTALATDTFAIRGHGYNSRLVMASTAGDKSAVLAVGNDSTQRTDWIISGLSLEFENYASITTLLPALDIKSGARGIVENLRILNAATAIKLGDTTSGGSINQVKFRALNVHQRASLGGLGIDIQSSAGHFFDSSNFWASGTAASSFRGLKFHPGINDKSDTGKFNACEWNYGGSDPQYNHEFDATNNHIAAQQFSICVIDQATTSNIWMHIDSGAVAGAYFQDMLYEGCVSNGSTGANTVLLDNTGGKMFSFSWKGGHITSIGSGAGVRAQGGNRIDAAIETEFIRRSTSGSANGAVVLATGTSGVSVRGSRIETRNLEPAGTTPFVPYNHLVYCEGEASNCSFFGNDAKLALTGAVYEGSVSAANKATNIVDKNLGPSGPIHGRGPMTVAGLPSATRAGHREVVTDATATTFMSTVAGGGSNIVPVVADGTNWKIG